MLKNDTLENGTSRIGLYGSAPPGVKPHRKCTLSLGMGMYSDSQVTQIFTGNVHGKDQSSRFPEIIV